MNRQELLKAYKKLDVKIESDNCDYCNSCYNCNYCNDCYDCNDCKNCNNTILCKNLENKKTGYWLLNKEVTKEEWLEARKELGYE